MGERCRDYIRDHPTSVVKGAVVGVTAYYTIPLMLGGLLWLPYFGAGYYFYRNTKTVETGFSWARWIQKNIFDPRQFSF